MSRSASCLRRGGRNDPDGEIAYRHGSCFHGTLPAGPAAERPEKHAGAGNPADCARVPLDMGNPAGYRKQRLFAAALLAAAMAAPAAPAKDAAAKRAPKGPKEDVSQIGDRNVGGGVNFYSLEKEIQIGRQMAQDVERQAKIVEDPVIAEYVNRIGQNLARNSDAKVPFTIKVIDSDELNAFALPGGFFFVNTGIVDLAGDEAELAGVMAHEIAHVAARHGTRNASRGQIADMASIPLIFLGGWAGYGIRQAAGFAVPMTFLKFSREFEKQADFLGVQYLYKAGYDPASMVQFFERLKAAQKRKTSKIAAAFGTHPLTEKRIEIVQKTIDELLPEQPQYALTNSEFMAVKTRLAQLRNRRVEPEEDPNRPRLRRSAPSETIAVEEADAAEDAGGEDDRPVLRRRRLAD